MREKLIWENQEFGIVSPEGLIKMKEFAGRAKDFIDIEWLENEES